MNETLTWQEVDDFGVPVVNLREGDKFVNVVANYQTQGFEEVVGEVVYHGVASVTVLLNRSAKGGGRLTEMATWAPEAKVLKV